MEFDVQYPSDGAAVIRTIGIGLVRFRASAR